MVLTVDTRKAFRRHADLVALVEAVLNADPADESDWIEWKTGPDPKAGHPALDPKSGHTARHILGFANRHPTRAQQAEGCGYLIFGAEPGNLRGIGRIDPADLDAGLSRYLGDTGPQWSPHNLRVQGALVLVIVVEPPRQGDPIHYLRKAFEKYLKGAVFVRRMGRTEIAGDEMQYLQDRLRHSAAQIEVDVDWSGGPARVAPIDLGEASISAWIAGERHRLMQPYQEEVRRRIAHRAPRKSVEIKDFTRDRSSDGLTIREYGELRRRHEEGEELTAEEQSKLARGEAAMRQVQQAVTPLLDAIRKSWAVSPEDRSLEEYQEEVEQYLETARQAAPKEAVATAVRRGLGRLCPVIVNHTDRNYPQVEVELHITGPVAAWERAPEVNGLPKPPRLFGTPTSRIPGYMLDPGFLRSAIPPMSARLAFPSMVEIDNSASARLRFAPIDLRPKRQERLAQVHLVVPAELAGQQLIATWTATSSGADGVATGQLMIEIEPTSTPIGDLLASVDSSEGDGD